MLSGQSQHKHCIVLGNPTGAMTDNVLTLESPMAHDCLPQTLAHMAGRMSMVLACFLCVYTERRQHLTTCCRSHNVCRAP